MTQPNAVSSKASATKSAADRVREWLDQHGAALEMRVASQFYTSSSPEVEHSGYFRDVESGKLREFDVHATFNGRRNLRSGSFSIHVVAECKASTAPWVVYMSSNSPVGAREWDFEGDFEVFSESGNTVRNLHGFSSAPLFRANEHAYQLAETGTKDNSAGFAAGLQLLDAVEGIRAGHDDAASTETHAHRGYAPELRIYVPVLVTSSPLFKVHLSSTGDVDIEETHIAAWLFKRKRKADGEIVRRLVWVVREDSVDEVVAKAV